MTSSILPLSTWDQIAPRGYIQQVYCFPYKADGAEDIEALRQSLSTALDAACADLPDFANRVVLLQAPHGHLALSKHADNQIVLQVMNCTNDYEYDFARLVAESFPAQAFVAPILDTNLPPLIDDGCGIPVAHVQARVIRGGLLLSINVHHTVVDGIGMKKFVSRFAYYTIHKRSGTGISEKGHTGHYDLPKSIVKVLLTENTYNDLITQCNEYRDDAGANGPLSFLYEPSRESFDRLQKIGHVFIVRADRIDRLKAMAVQHGLKNADAAAQRHPSTFACLAALAWMFTTVARLKTANREYFRDSLRKSAERKTSLILPASWKRRAFPQVPDENCGNTVAMVNVETALEKLLAATASYHDTTEDATVAFARVVYLIDATLGGINEEYITKRTAMIRSSPDPRRTGTNHNPLDPCSFIFNSWRLLGADTEWNIPGVTTTSPAAVRRSQSEFNMSAGLIMPGARHKKDYEVLVTLDQASMDELRSDSAWCSWTDCDEE